METAHTYDPAAFPREYGGFSLLYEEEKREVVDLVFGDDGLRVGIVKMFLGPNHQSEPGGPFDHETTASHMRDFVRRGLRATRARGDDLEIITTLYGPPGFMTLQREDRGRDLAPDFADDLALYMIDWVKFLRERDGLPVRYVSPHNEGESWRRWDAEGRTENAGHDYNLYWPPEHINTFLKTMPGLLEEHGLGDVGVTPGEPSNWWRFTTWGYADAITGDRDAMAGIDLLTSHGFYLGPFGRWHGDHNVHTARKFREAKPGLRSWVTSTSWKKMDSRFVFEQFGTIYLAEANAIIPWAGMQRPVQWIGGDPNPGCAIRVSEEGDYTVLPGYHFYKQLTRLGRPGTDVVETFAMDSEVVLIGFGRGDSDGPDGFAAVNIDKNPRSVSVALSGTDATAFRAVRTTEAGERYAEAGRHTVSDETLSIRLPARSVTSFFGESD